jgi:hypothetical protein
MRSEMPEIPNESVTIKVNNKDIVLDPENMKFNEFTLSEYMDKEYAWIDYYGKQLELATKELSLAELAYETKYNELYITHKDSGGSDAYCKAKAQCDQLCVSLQERVIDRRAAVGFLKNHLRAWDKNHDNAQNRGHTLRKELDKLNRDIYKDDKDDKMCNTDEFVR